MVGDLEILNVGTGLNMILTPESVEFVGKPAGSRFISGPWADPRHTLEVDCPKIPEKEFGSERLQATSKETLGFSNGINENKREGGESS